MPKHIRARVDDTLLMRELLVRGVGIGNLPHFLGEPYVADGRLVRVMPGLTAHTSHVYVVSSSARHLPQRVRAYRELLIETLKNSALRV
ncbi:MAG: hypothetical protein H6718_20705 [Polyangiaceae bacterium]|nr:hypothetical protein [Myxococcales bacterium]MCB9587837.1 hypothetical protein [Polyangiaceae bacterium]MCB9608786.1 hypothetical protein [Polyangiaceae bacterium]